MLTLTDISSGYGPVQVLTGLSLTLPPGEVTCVMGRNGTGKSTLLKTIMGLVPATSGTIALNGTELQDLPAHQVPRHGIGYVPQGRRLFGDLTVAENIEIGLMTRHNGPDARERVLDLFPRLRDRLSQVSRTLSGGEQQMLAIARALCLDPLVLMLDEPTEGLQPSMISLIRDTVHRLKREGTAILLVEQRVDAVIELADTVGFMADGRIAEHLPAAGLTPKAEQFRRYVGV